MQSRQNVQQAVDEGKQLWSLVQKYAKLELVERLTSIYTALILGGVLFVICSIALYCFCMYLVHVLEAQTENLALSFAIVGFALLLIGFLVFCFRNTLIIRPIIKSLIKDNFADEMQEVIPETQDNTDNSQQETAHS